MPTSRHTTNHGRDSTTRVSQGGAGRPVVSASYLGVRQASASTVKLTVRAATAPAMVSPSGIGRSFEPPIPWANTSPSAAPGDAVLKCYFTSSWTIVFSSACDSTVTMPGLSIVNGGNELVPAPYASSCSGSEWTWISPSASAVTTRTIGWLTFTSTRSPFGVTLSPEMVTLMVLVGRSLVFPELSSPPQAASPAVPATRARAASARRIKGLPPGVGRVTGLTIVTDSTRGRPETSVRIPRRPNEEGRSGGHVSERLRQRDLAFLELETPTTPCHNCT